VSTNADRLLERLEAEYGAALSAVASYDRDDYTVHYVDDRVAAQYSTAEMDAIYDDVVLSDVGQPLQEQLFDDLGAVRGKIRLFEDGTVAHFWPTETDEGLFLTFDASADPGVRGLLDLAREFYA
jgi:hypothetical protein